MIVTDKLYRGEDKTITIILKDDDNVGIAFADLVDAKAIVRINKQEVARFSKEVAAGYDDIVEDAENPNNCKILLTAADTAKYMRGLLEVEFSMNIEDEDYPTVGRKETEIVALYNVE